MIRTAIRPILRFIRLTPGVRTLVLTLLYSVTVALCLWLAYLLRFDFEIPPPFSHSLPGIVCVAIAIKLVCLLFSHQFDGLLTYFSTPDLKRLLAGCVAGSAILGWLRETAGVAFAPPHGVILADLVFCFVALCTIRLAFRSVRNLNSRSAYPPAGRTPRRVAIVGAGDSGAALAKDLLAKRWLALQPVAFFDDYRKPPASVHGVPVLGGPQEIAAFMGGLRIEEVIIAMPSAPAKRIREIVKIIHAAGLTCRTVPSLDQLATGRVSVSSLRPVDIQDLLGRTQVVIDGDTVRGIIAGKTVMVTGAGGSIGSELCRQILSFGPAALLLVERSEPQLFLIEQELLAAPHGGAIVPLVVDITQGTRLRETFRTFRPQVVFHAAAHKHVPMMELQPQEAIRNNILGTAQLAEMAIEHAVERFVFISTDKAVNPTSVMGATKRFAEIHLQSLSTRAPGTEFMAVRFGNVLGSSGSVVPTFSRQIAAGGPVTVTDPEMTRFFMTIPEAVTLVLQSAALGEGGNIFVLDMGKPVRILDLAMQMIALSGLRPHEDIEIVFTGLRPGEKLYEELSHSREKAVSTVHPKIMQLISEPQNHSYVQLALDELASAINDADIAPEDLKRLLVTTIQEYTPFGTASAAGSDPELVNAPRLPQESLA